MSDSNFDFHYTVYCNLFNSVHPFQFGDCHDIGDEDEKSR